MASCGVREFRPPLSSCVWFGGIPAGGYQRVHGELTTLGILVAPSTVWEILKQDGLEPASERASTTWADFLRSKADALLACDFVETVTLNGQRQYILAVIDDAARRVRVLGTTHRGSAVGVGIHDVGGVEAADPPGGGDLSGEPAPVLRLVRQLGPYNLHRDPGGRPVSSPGTSGPYLGRPSRHTSW